VSALNEFIEQIDWPKSVLVTDAGWIFDPDIVEGLPVWEWENATGEYTTRVSLDPTNGRQVRWEVWDGEYQVSNRAMETYGVKAALHLISNWRVFGLDEREVTRVVAEDAAASEHALYPDRCNTCPTCGCPGSE
jgi:hypothetical protein